jgi:tetratricopeptide (TPR) repeat protein
MRRTAGSCPVACVGFRLCRVVLVLSGFAPLLFSSNAGSADPDRTPPSVRILEPATGTEIGGDTLTVEIEYRDAGSGIAARTLHVLLNGTDYAGQFDQHSRGASGQIALPKSLPIGDSTLTVEIADRAGNVARADTKLVYAGSPQEHYNAGLAHAQAGRWSDAAASFAKAVKFDPKDTDAYVQLGHAYQHLKRYPDAVTAYRQATELKADDLEARLSLGDALMRSNDYAGAANAYRKATEIDPKRLEAFTSLGVAYRADQKYTEAKEAFTAARRINPADADILIQIGILELVRKNYLAAELSFRRAVLMNPKSTPAHIGLGEAYYQQARYDKAAEAYTQALQVNPQSAKARFGLGMVYLRLNDRAKTTEQVRFLGEVDKSLSEELRKRLTE